MQDVKLLRATIVLTEAKSILYSKHKDERKFQPCQELNPAPRYPVDISRSFLFQVVTFGLEDDFKIGEISPQCALDSSHTLMVL
ncbi:hypothetical protein M8J75_002340 [Diaphorina citri]|nr:hypothetical protein M8J75_002340 [Diaphorina citri]